MGRSWVDLREDWHVHSTFSDGTSTVDENIDEALRVGLTRVMLVDHVRVDTTWVPEFAAAVDTARARAGGLTVSCGVEAKLLDTTGLLDLPSNLPRGLRIVAADHQVPTPGGPAHPREVSAALESGDLDPLEVTGWIVGSTVSAIERYPRVLVAHLFSILPKIGLDESVITGAQLSRIAQAAARYAAIVEISERWRCPGARTLAVMRSAGVRIVASTDSHALDSIGRYVYVDAMARDAVIAEEGQPTART